jgi:hypothetical protein
MWDQVQQALNQSMVQLLSHVASLLPGIVALIVAFLLSVVLAGLLSVILRRFLVSVRFDERLIHWGMSSMAEWSPANSPTLLVTRIVAGSIIIVGLLIGLAAFDAALISELVLRLFAYLPRILTAVIVLVVGSVIARFLARSVLIGGVNMNLQYARLVSVGVEWLVIVLSVAMALEHLDIGTGMVHLAFGILFGGIVLALALAVGLGSKELVSRSLEREVNKAPAPAEEEPFRHL